MVEVLHILHPAAAAAQQALAEVEAAMSVRELVPTAVAALAPVEAGVAVLTGAAMSVRELVPTAVAASALPGAAAFAPVEAGVAVLAGAEVPVEELILSEVEPLARELAQKQELAVVGIRLAARVELAREQAPIVQDLL